MFDNKSELVLRKGDDILDKINQQTRKEGVLVMIYIQN